MLPGQDEGFWAPARDAQLDGFAPIELAEARAGDASLTIQAPDNTRALAGVDPERIARAARARAPVREAALRRRWCGTLWPTPALAQQAGMGTREFAAFVRARPVPRPRRPGRRVARAARAPGAADRAPRAARASCASRPTGTDLRCASAGRTWVNSDGRRNMPSGEVFTGPLEDSAKGTIRFTIPSSPRGVEVAGVELTFRDGRGRRRARRARRRLPRRTLATDPGARRLGEIGIGTNAGIDRPIGAILFDEKIGGTVHLALGRSYPETGGINESRRPLGPDLRPARRRAR